MGEGEDKKEEEGAVEERKGERQTDILGQHQSSGHLHPEVILDIPAPFRYYLEKNQKD